MYYFILQAKTYIQRIVYASQKKTACDAMELLQKFHLKRYIA